ncbi:AraC family transcriptional regulator [Marinifilum sp. JC120]|nr:AraC family transcriptional regulator [Marinifilum sp. JC120]
MSNHRIKQQAFPCPELYRYVDRFWAWEGDESEGLLRSRMLPGTGKEVTFHYGAPLSLEYRDGEIEKLPRAHLICLRSKSAILRASSKTKFISIRFRTGAFRYFCPIPAEQLADSFIDAGELLGAESRLLAQQIDEANDFQERVRFIEAYLLKRLHPLLDNGRHIDHAVDSFYYDHSFVRPVNISDQVGMGVRQFQRMFKTAMGVTPKRFIRLSRFQHTVKSLLLIGADDMLGTALEHGYYDQSHFIRDFKEFTGQTPRSFLDSQTSMTHFYNTSRPQKTIVQSSTK